jgi:uncharacterized protein (TIGR02678 family)
MTETAASDRGRRAWQPEASVETAAALRLLMVRPWLVAGRDDDAIATIRMNVEDVRAALSRLGWTVVVERDVVRLMKSPPSRTQALSSAVPSQRACQWYFLLVAAAESLGRRVALGALVNAARAAAAEAGIDLTNDISERRAIVAGLRMLVERGAVTEIDGDVEGYLQTDEPAVLVEIHHTRLLHVIANYAGETDPVESPEGWLEAVGREPDAARRMRRRLVDDAVVYTGDLDTAEADWLSRRLRGDDGGPLAEAFGLHIERRVEGAAFVVPDETYRHLKELGPFVFPTSGTVPHAALLLCNWAAISGTVGQDHPGWRRIPALEVAVKLSEFAAGQQTGSGGWSRELTEDIPGHLQPQVFTLLQGLDLVRVDGDDWLFGPVIARWPAPQPKTTRRRSVDGLLSMEQLDGPRLP